MLSLKNVYTYRLNWVKKTSWGWSDESNGTALKTQDSKFAPWRSQTEHATSSSQMLPIVLDRYLWVGMKHFVCLKPVLLCVTFVFSALTSCQQLARILLAPYAILPCNNKRQYLITLKVSKSVDTVVCLFRAV